jgi:hypothetical protein
MEGHSSRIKQTEDSISELENEMAIKGKIEELLVKQLKTCEKKMQVLTPSKDQTRESWALRRRRGASKRNA